MGVRHKHRHDDLSVRNENSGDPAGHGFVEATERHQTALRMP